MTVLDNCEETVHAAFNSHLNTSSVFAIDTDKRQTIPDCENGHHKLAVANGNVTF